jgi:uncharacterized glyoxalase superfamily protein PhnB/uncharacterized protein YndB with AHSA1/START domain
MMMRATDMPPDVQVTAPEQNRVMHARLKVGDRLLMGGDAPPERSSKPSGFCSHIMIDDPAEAERVFRELGEGGNVVMPIGETFWARRFGIVHDRFGVPWMVNCEIDMGAPKPAVTPFVVSRTFNVPREKLWASFTDAERMKKWWGPKGAKIVSSTLDLRPGGTYHYGMQIPDGQQVWGRQVFRVVEPHQRIEFINSFSDEHGGLARHPLAPSWPLELHTVFEFKDAGSGKSALTVTWTPYHASEAEIAAFDNGHESMKNGWGGTLDKLDAYLAVA